jgi:flagellar basal-body rod protein FlgB
MAIDPIASILSDALSGLQRRTEAIAANIANVDTPGYRPVQVDFEASIAEQLRRVRPGDPDVGRVLGEPGSSPIGDLPDLTLARSSSRQIAGDAAAASGGIVTTTTDAGGRNDGNTVDVEAQMISLTQTQIKTSVTTRMLSGHLDMIKTVLNRR